MKEMKDISSLIEWYNIYQSTLNTPQGLMVLGKIIELVPTTEGMPAEQVEAV